MLMNETEVKKEEVTGTKKVVGVQFSAAGKIHMFDAGSHDLNLHDIVVVEGDKGPILGRVAYPVHEKPVGEVATNIRTVIRKAEGEDAERYQKNREEAMNAFNLCQEKIVEHNLPMKLVDVNYLIGDGKVIFYFTAEERVDFRKLVKDLATVLHMRIEMRQIGARDASKCIGGLGCCGLICCCAKYLREFKSIAIQMAKNQGLSPNPAKLTGMCGKLKCCLNYENEMYSELKKPLPHIGAEVETPKGKGVVSNHDIPRQFVYVFLEETSKEVRFNLSEIKVMRKKEKKKEKKEEKNDVEEQP